MVTTPPGILELDTWHTPATDYPLQTVGKARLTRGSIPVAHYDYSGMDGNVFWKPKDRGTISITGLELKEGRHWQTWMIDGPSDHRPMEKFAEAAFGHVLIGGLGLGLVIHELVKNPKVHAVTVIDRDPDVIKMMTPLVPACEIIQADFYDFVGDCQKTRRNFDTVIVDIWHWTTPEDKQQAYTKAVEIDFIMRHIIWPAAQISYHGFVGLSDVKVVTPEMVVYMMELHNMDDPIGGNNASL